MCCAKTTHTSWALSAVDKEIRRTYKIANFRGLVATIGKRAKQMTKHAAAPILSAPKTRSRSHLLTEHRVVSKYLEGGTRSIS